MKLKLSHRLLLYIGALVLLAFGTAAILACIFYNQIVFSAENQSFFTLSRLLFILGGALLIAFGAFCLSLPGKMKLGKVDFISQKTASGEMRISMPAIESIVTKSLEEHKEIKLQQLKVANARSGLEVDVSAVIAGNVNMPLAVSAIQQHIRKQLQATTGVEAKEVRVTIEKADLQANDSKFAVTPQELALKPANEPPAGFKPATAPAKATTEEGTHGEVGRKA